MSHLSENRLIGYTIKATKPTRVVTGYDPLSGAPITSTAAQASNAAQVATHQKTPAGDGVNAGEFVGNLNPSTGLVQSTPVSPSDLMSPQQRQSQDDINKFNAYEGNGVYGNVIDYKGAPTPVRQPQRITKTPTSRATSRTTTQPTSTTSTRYGTSDLQSAVEKRKQERLSKLGIQSQDFAQVEGLLSKGYKYGGTDNNQPYFINAAGERQTIGLNDAGARAAVDLATSDIGAEIQNEQGAAIVAEKEKARATKTALDKAGKEKFIAGMDTSAITKTKSQIDQLMSSIQGLDPSLQQAILPGLIQLQQSNNDYERQVNEMIASYPTEASIEASGQDEIDYVKQTSAEYKALLAKNNQTSLEIAKYNNDALKIEKQIIDHNAAVAEQKQLAANVDGEKKLRRQLNRLGIQTDVQGLTFLQSEIQKGADALNNLKTGNNLVSLKAQLAIGEGYRLEVKQAMETYEGNYLNIITQTADKVSSIKNSISTAKSDRTKGIIEAKKWGLEQKQANDKETRATISAANKAMEESKNTLRDDERAQETLGWNILNSAIDNYGSKVPKSIIDRVSKMLPAGTDIQDIINTPTFAERANKRISGAGGMGGNSSGGGSYDISSTTGASAAFSGVTSNQLREAVDRVTLSFGGTGEERNRKRGEYLDRIASGENPASIMTSMQNDYWVSQKGAEKTRHDERTGIADSMDALQAKIDYYGQDTLDREALGFIQSKAQGLGSYVGLSSDTYNDIASYVGNIRAKIVKENYGSAVTEQELALARSYIPDLTKPASQFAQNVYNLKSYNQYLDAKSFASNVGLPAPKPPAPITLSGGGITGTAKYSPNDILNALK